MKSRTIWIIILIILVILLILNTSFFIKRTSTKNDIKYNQKTSEPEILEKGLYYPIELEELQYNVSEVIKKAETNSYAIRILINSDSCENPLPDGGCTGNNTIPPVYNFINVNFNLSDENRSYSTIEGAWETSSNKLGVENDHLHFFEFSKEGHKINIIGYPFFLPSENISVTSARELIHEEFEGLGIIIKGDIIFGEGYKNDIIIQGINVNDITTNISEEKYCENDSDCILVISGCKPCPSCRTYKITDSDVIAVNKNTYKCPSFNGACIACIDIFEFDRENDAVCINNQCEKRIS